MIQFSFVETLSSVQNSLKCVFKFFITYILPAEGNFVVVIFRVINQFNLMVYSIWIVCIFFEPVWHQNLTCPFHCGTNGLDTEIVCMVFNVLDDSVSFFLKLLPARVGFLQVSF